MMIKLLPRQKPPQDGECLRLCRNTFQHNTYSVHRSRYEAGELVSDRVLFYNTSRAKCLTYLGTYEG